MKLAFYDSFRLGVVVDDTIVDMSGIVEGIPATDPQDVIRHVIEEWQTFRPRFADLAAKDGGVPLESVRIRPPLPRPTNIVCIAVNYRENGARTVQPPIDGFHRSVNCVIGDGDVMRLPDAPATIFHGEAELAIIIGRRATNVPAADVMDHVFGYTNLIDGSARGLPPGGFYQMKSRETFCPIGPFIVTADEVPNPENLSIRLWNNGTLMQDFNTSDMAHGIGQCVEFASSVHTLEPGDIVSTGTNHLGLGPFMDGDRIELEVEHLGRLHIDVHDELKRTWARETILQRAGSRFWESVENGGPHPHTPQLTGKYAKE